jgi:N-dimethylarginine dimethylaminohydrolase
MKNAREVIVMGLPPRTNDVKGMWYDGYPVHKGECENSVNYATVYASKNNIRPDQEVLKNDWLNFINTLLLANFHLHIVPFPAELNKPDSLYHDAVFIRDSGIMYKGIWIKSRFSVPDRAFEGEFSARLMQEKFDKTVVMVPEGGFIEGGDINYLETIDGSYYFGGLSRSNRKGHEFINEIMKPDKTLLIDSEGYHLDTLFTPVVNKDNKLVALIIAKDSVNPKSYAELKRLNIEVIDIEAIDSSGTGKELGTYAVNALISPGIMVSSSKFATPGVEERLEKLGVSRLIAPLRYFRFAGGSVHCLTNEIYN